jgi:HD-like signal output (HDOD) protein
MTGSGTVYNQPQGLEEWAELLRAEEMPIFSSTAQNIYSSLDDRHKGVMDLATIILQDPSLTAKLLKVGNSSYYNPSRHKMSTVSRAIVILGVEVIRELTLACSFFESILTSANKERANQEIALAIHAAVQARELAIVLKDPSPEEVFIAALLHNIGQIAFWCSGNRQVTQIHDLIAKSSSEPGMAEKKVLGFTLQELSKKLSKAWHLSGLVVEAIHQPESMDARIRNVQMGERICQALKAGWQSAEMDDCVRELASLTGDSAEVIHSKIKNGTAKAADIAHQFGAHAASKYISPDEFSADVENSGSEPFDKKQLQFQILQEITAHISGDIDLNVLFEMVLEGVHRGLEMDRTIFLLLSSDKKSLKEKISLGRVGELEKLQIDNVEAGGNLFFHVLNEGDGSWIKPHQYPDLYTQQVVSGLGKHECFVFPVDVENKAIGLIYCDRALRGQPLSLEEFSVANHFVKQAHIGLTLYRMKKH